MEGNKDIGPVASSHNQLTEIDQNRMKTTDSGQEEKRIGSKGRWKRLARDVRGDQYSEIGENKENLPNIRSKRELSQVEPQGIVMGMKVESTQNKVRKLGIAQNSPKVVVASLNWAQENK